MVLDESEQAIIEALRAVVRASDSTTPWKRRDWTAQIRDSLSRLGTERGLLACPSPSNHPGRRQGGWLYDVTWLRYDGSAQGNLLGVELVAESELEPKDDESTFDDFQKLLVARAVHRLFVFPRSDDAAVKIIQQCREYVRAFKGTQPGDRYLFAALILDMREFHFEPYVTAADG